MRFWIFSDFHLEHGTTPVEDLIASGIPEADICLCAGDIHYGAKAIQVLDHLIGSRMPVVTTLGNHEFYGGEYHQVRREAQAAASHASNLTLLDPGAFIAGDVRVIGATLWTDYRLHGDAYQDEAMAKARHMLADHDQIRHRNKDRTVSAWSPYHARKQHEDELSYIINYLSQPFDGKTVVLTHHAPHPASIHPRFRQGPSRNVNVGFASDLTRIIEKFQPALWVHGHMHDGVDHFVGSTRVIANPRGYTRSDGTRENPSFHANLVIDI